VVVCGGAQGEPNCFQGAMNALGNGAEVGLLLEVKKKRLHVYANGRFVATAFTVCT
jgi:hypothetical protein